MPVRFAINECCFVWGKKKIVLAVQQYLKGRLLKEMFVCSFISYQYDSLTHCL
jgi:hypothetical protein